MADNQVEVIFDPSKGMIACVLLQAAFGCNSSIPQIFDTKDWLLAPSKGMERMSATRAQWQQIAAMPRAERIAKYEALASARTNLGDAA